MAYADAMKRGKRDLIPSDCTICQLTLKDARLLECGHEFCKECIAEWIVNSPLNKTEEKGIDCPVCRQVTKPPRAGSHPSEWAALLVRKQSELSPTDEGKIFCDPCRSTSTSVVASVYCLDCQEHLCNECHTSHKKLRVGKGHTVIDSSNGPETSMEVIELNNLIHCKKHAQNEFEFFCYDHDELVCSTCAFIEHRNCDEVVDIETNPELVTDCMPSFITRENTRGLHSHVTGIIHTQEKYEELLQRDMDDIPIRLKQFRNMVNRRMDTFEAKVLHDAKEMHSALDKAIKDERKRCEGISNRLGAHMRITEGMSQLAESSRRRFVLTRSLQKERESIKSNLYMEGSTCLPDEFKQIKFQSNESFAEMLNDATNIGVVQSITREMDSSPAPAKECTTLGDFTIVQVKQIRQSKTTRKSHQAPRCQFLDDSNIAIAEKANVLHIVGTVDDMENRQVKLKNQPYGLAFIPNRKTIAITHPTARKISVYNTYGEFTLSHEIKTKAECYGIVQMEDGFLVSLCENLDDWSLCKMSIDGKVIRELGGDANGRKFETLWFFAEDRGSVYQSCSHSDQVYKFDLEKGTPHFEYRSDHLRNVADVAVDSFGNVYVCGMASKNIHILSPSGDALKIFEPPGCNVPMHLACSKDGGHFVVVDRDNKHGPYLYAFKIYA